MGIIDGIKQVGVFACEVVNIINNFYQEQYSV
jgi:hypothetical protein